MDAARWKIFLSKKTLPTAPEQKKEKKFSNLYPHPGGPIDSKHGEPGFISSLFLHIQTMFASPEQVAFGINQMSKAKYTVNTMGTLNPPNRQKCGSLISSTYHCQFEILLKRFQLNSMFRSI